MSLSFVILFELTFVQVYLYDGDSGAKNTKIFLKYLISLIITIIINIMNSFNKLVLEKLTHLKMQI